MRFAFAGDRDLAVECLEFLLERGDRPEVLLLAGPKRASHADRLAALCAPFLPPERILRGTWFRGPKGQAFLRELDLDLALSVHFPYIVPPEVLAMPARGFLNLHPAYLPYNRGWHTPTWALLEDTPIGATFHVMDDGVDTGDILAQRALQPTLGDTANTLYAKLKALEVELFREAWPALVEDQLHRQPQDPDAGTSHVKADLFT
ncbi:MAG: formyltransferase family protein, partial [Myxococcota bacterium]